MKVLKIDIGTNAIGWAFIGTEVKTSINFTFTQNDGKTTPLVNISKKTYIL